MDESQQRSAVVAEAQSWLGTPYHHHGRIKGVGVDCAQILCAVFEAAGRVGRIDLGNYPPDWHHNRSEEMFERLVEENGGRRVDEPQVGDVTLFRFGRCFSHGGILVQPRVVLHAYINASVMLTALDEAPLAGRPVHYWSLW